ncbi:MAG: hypothetical protein U0939_23265 [Pirellulales bacterium]
MNYSPADIDRLVREVVRRLTEAAPAPVASAAGVAAASSAAVAAPVVAAPAVAPAVAIDDWRPTERVITAATLDARPATARTLVVGRGVVVTPAAKDRLRQLKMELRVDSNGASTATVQAGKVYIHATTGALVGAPLAKLVAAPAWQTESLVAAPLAQAVAELSAVLADARHVGVLVTSDRDLALCLANRRSTVRAVAAGEKSAVAAAVREWGANLLIVDPRRASIPTIKQWIDAFLLPGPRNCPAPWNQHLSS